jgi:predicted NBD/HSP70 family sugar kinase
MSGATAVVVGLDVGGNKTNATVLDDLGRFLVDRMIEVASRVREGPAAAVAATEDAMELALTVTGTQRGAVGAIGLDTPGPASADGVISARGATSAARLGWPANSVTSRSPWTGCLPPGSRSPGATAVYSATWKASPRSAASPTTSCRSG